jgi:transposase
VELLQSAPRIGMFTAIRLALEWGDISRFQRKKEFAGFLGLVPSDYSLLFSGKIDKSNICLKIMNLGYILLDASKW